MSEREIPWHYLRKNKASWFPSNLLFFDTECFQQPVEGEPKKNALSLRLGVATFLKLREDQILYRKVCHFRTPSEFFQFVHDHTWRKRRTWIFAHNLGFDFTQVCGWQALEAGEFKIKMCCLESPPCFLDLRSGYGATRWVDSFNYFQTSLEEMGKSVGVNKMKFPEWSCADKELFDYCENDVVILETAILALIKFLRENGCGVFQPTLSGCSFHAFRHKFLDDDLLVHRRKETLELERSAYFGGRCQQFFAKKKNGPIHHLDVNSMYPALMASESFPVRLLGTEAYGTVGRIKDLLPDYGVIARVMLNSPFVCFPLRRSGQLYFVQGRFVTTLAGPELKLAIQRGLVHAVEAYSWYELRKPFRKFVKHFWSKRREYKEKNQKVMADLTKLLMNSLGGKFGQRSKRWDDVPDVIPAEKWGYWWEDVNATGKPDCFRGLGQHTQRYCDGGEGQNSMPAISAYLTSYGRVMLNHLIETAGENNVFYVDTDSLHVTEQGRTNLENDELCSQTALGKLKIVETFSWAEYLGSKAYRTNLGDRITGLKRVAQKEGTNLYRQTQFEGLRQLVARQPDGKVYTREIEVNVETIRPRGRIDHYGRVIPYQMPDDLLDSLLTPQTAGH